MTEVKDLVRAGERFSNNNLTVDFRCLFTP